MFYRSIQEDYVAFDAEGNILAKKDAQSPSGHKIEVYVLKTKTCKWDRKLGYMTLDYVRGIDTLQDTLDVATHFGYIDNSVQGTFKLVDIDTGEIMCDNEGKEIKIRGKKNLTTYFREHIDQWKKLYNLVYEKLRQKDDPYIVSFEQLLNRNINEELGTDNTEEM